MDTDVLIIGGGMAGVCAALSAAEAGADVIVWEWDTHLGGSTIRSAGLLAFADTDEQRASGVSDSSEVLRRDLIETGKHRNDEALVDAYVDNQAATYRWLKAKGISFGEPHAGSGQSAPRSHPVDTTEAIRLLANAARDLGATIEFGVRAQRLVVADGRVVGARADHNGEPLEINATSTVLTTGGFSRNQAMLKRFAPSMEHAVLGGGPNCQGDGILMAGKVGAGLADLPYVKGTFGIFPWPSPYEDGTGILVVYKGAIAVNGFGERFCDESSPYKEIGDVCLAQPEHVAFQIFDDSVMAAADAHVEIYNFRKRLEGRQIVRAGTIAELADGLGLPADELVATVDDYNARITSGAEDRFGRRTLVGGVGRPQPLVTAPFYGFPSTTVVLATYAGVSVSADGEVLDTFGEPIPGLYAAGEVTGGFHGGGYVTGTSIGKSAVFGRLAGRHAVGVGVGVNEGSPA